MSDNHGGEHLDDDHDPGHRHDPAFEGRTYLFIRDDLADRGVAPSPNPWLSPDIIITPPGGDPGDEPKEGVPNAVAVLVSNAGGMPAIDVWVDVFVTDPSTGWTPAEALRVGGTYIDVMPYGTASVNLTWTPAPGPSHRCMLARCSLIVPTDTYADAENFDVSNDRHIAQRNLSIVAMLGQFVAFRFRLVNPLPAPAEFIIRAAHIEPTAENIVMLRRTVGCGFAQFGETPLRNFDLAVEDPISPGETAGKFGVLDEPAGDIKSGGETTEHRLRMETGEVRGAVLTVERNPNTRPGEIHIMEVAQISTKTDRPVGGLWIVVQH